nr:MAG TPA: hypothetical protein [Caudoviricetes sp.]
MVENTRFELVTSCMPCIFYWFSWLFMAFHSFSYRLQQHLSSNFIFHIFAYLCTQ